MPAEDRGKLDEAIGAYGRATELRPDWAEAHGALGDALREQGRLDQAIEECRKVIRAQARDGGRIFGPGQSVSRPGRTGKAMAAYATAIQLRPNWPDADDSLGNALWDEERIDEAIAAYSKAVELNPGHLRPIGAWARFSLDRDGWMRRSFAFAGRWMGIRPTPRPILLGHTLQRASRMEAASAEYREAIRLRPDTPEWQFKLAALLGDRSVTTAPTHYVRELFEEYAAKFDKHLVEKLKYQAPQQLLRAVGQATPRRDLDVLDLGCGTGLCGQLLRPYAGRLMGVDLSPEMIRVAQKRGIYDQLIIDELMPVLRERRNASIWSWPGTCWFTSAT